MKVNDSVDLKMNDSNSSSKDDDGVLVAAVVTSFAITPIYLAAFVLIIRYEQSCSDLRRVFTNRMVSSACWSSITWLIVGHVPELIRLLMGSYPASICRIHFVLKNAALLQVVLFYDAMVVVRYLLIFVMKNPFGFQNEFWSFFVNVSVVTFSCISPTVHLLLPGKDPLQVNLCAGLVDDDSSLAAKLNWQFLLIMAASLCVHVGANGKIKIFKMRQNMPCVNVDRLTRGKRIIEQLVISDCIANFFILVGLVATAAVTFSVDLIDPRATQNFPANVVVLCHLLLTPFVFPTTITATYFFRHRPLFEATLRLFKSCLGHQEVHATIT